MIPQALNPPRPRPENPSFPFVGHLDHQGVDLDIETPAGGVRTGVDHTGKPWSVTLPYHYGEARGTVGADGDPIDVFVGPDPFSPYVYVVQARDAKTGKFDETKAMLGFRRKADAAHAFRMAYHKRGMLLGITRWPFGAWRAGIRRPHVSTGPMNRPLTKARLVLDMGMLAQLHKSVGSAFERPEPHDDGITHRNVGGFIVPGRHKLKFDENTNTSSHEWAELTPDEIQEWRNKDRKPEPEGQVKQHLRRLKSGAMALVRGHHRMTKAVLDMGKLVELHKAQVKAHIRHTKNGPVLVHAHVRKGDAAAPDQPADARAPAAEESKKFKPRSRDLPNVDKWVDKIPGLPDETWQTAMTGNPEHDSNAGPKDSRRDLHEQIIAGFTDHVPAPDPNHKKVAIVTMGGSGSGKSTILRSQGILNGKMVLVDPDAIKDQLPEYQRAVGHHTTPGAPRVAARNAAPMAHEESSYLAKKVRDRAIEQGKHLIIDGTGNNGNKMVSTIKALKARGYHVHVVFADINQETAEPRINERADRSGRLVDKKFYDGMYDRVAKNFEAIGKEAHTFQVFDRTQDRGHPVWAKTRDGKETHHDAEYVQKFKSNHYKQEGPQ